MAPVLRIQSVLVLLLLWHQVLAAATKNRRKILSEEPFIELWPNFLSSADTSALRTLAERETFEALGEAESSPAAEVSGGQELCTLNLSEAEEDGEENDYLWTRVRDLADHAVAWTSKSSSPANMSLAGLPAVLVARWESWRSTSALNRSGPLHLDARKQPRRQHAILAYLSGSGNAAVDGSTVFPCIETDDMESKEVTRRQKLCSRAARHLQLAHDKLLAVHAQGMQLPPSKQYDFLEQHPELTSLPKETSEGLRPVNWIWLPKHDEVAAEAPGRLRADPLHALAEAMCRGKAPGLRVASREGDALMMQVREEGSRRRKGNKPGKPDWRLWHAGCSPTEKAGYRWTAQVFFDEPAPMEVTNLSEPGTCSDRSVKGCQKGQKE
eukprot:TRINITY_DN28649_c0_g1_i1.p1 TRINITY_DN28649_c0_g1~~TRINITY_DN28649_c0_g1_i1.p1  ORF type:complete len:404 (-),score=89.00 TRINITY_DN28649_c0_g1_i1:146-1294(-)